MSSTIHVRFLHRPLKTVMGPHLSNPTQKILIVNHDDPGSFFADFMLNYASEYGFSTWDSDLESWARGRTQNSLEGQWDFNDYREDPEGYAQGYVRSILNHHPDVVLAIIESNLGRGGNPAVFDRNFVASHDKVRFVFFSGTGTTDEGKIEFGAELNAVYAPKNAVDKNPDGTLNNHFMAVTKQLKAIPRDYNPADEFAGVFNNFMTKSADDSVVQQLEMENLDGAWGYKDLWEEPKAPR